MWWHHKLDLNAFTKLNLGSDHKKSQKIAPTQRYLNDGYKTKPEVLNVNDKKRKLETTQMCSH